MTDRVRATHKDGTRIAVSHQVEQGTWYTDGWITPHLKLRFSGLRGIRRLILPVYCNDVSIRLFNNEMRLEFDSQTSVHPLKWGGSTVIEIPAGRVIDGDAGLVLRIGGYLLGDELDSRERAVVIKEILLESQAMTA
jgi:hypothetical protein